MYSAKKKSKKQTLEEKLATLKKRIKLQASKEPPISSGTIAPREGVKPNIDILSNRYREQKERYGATAPSLNQTINIINAVKDLEFNKKLDTLESDLRFFKSKLERIGGKDSLTEKAIAQIEEKKRNLTVDTSTDPIEELVSIQASNKGYAAGDVNILDSVEIIPRPQISQPTLRVQAETVKAEEVKAEQSAPFNIGEQPRAKRNEMEQQLKQMRLREEQQQRIEKDTIIQILADEYGQNPRKYQNRKLTELQAILNNFLNPKPPAAAIETTRKQKPRTPAQALETKEAKNEPVQATAGQAKRIESSKRRQRKPEEQGSVKAITQWLQPANP